MAQIQRPKTIGTRKQLFLDNEIVEGMWGLKRTYFPATKHAANPILCGEHPWEQGGVRLWGTVRREEDLFRMWYQGQGEKSSFTCYATSTDGLHWERPSLGIIEFGGSKENNIVFRGDGRSSGICVVRDDKEPDPKRRFKMAFTGRGGVGLCFSPDGLHWTMQEDFPIHHGHNDTLKTLLRDTRNEKWLMFARPETFAGPTKRVVALTESENGEDWTEFSTVILPDELDPPEFYYMSPFAYEGMYVGLLGPYWNATSSSIDAQLVTSRDAYHWERRLHREPFIGLGDLGAFDSHIIWVSTGPVRVEDELWFYYSGFDGRHDWRGHRASVGLAKLRIDGFACLDATDPATMGEAVAAARVDLPAAGGPVIEETIWPDEGVMITRPFVWEGDRLEINAWAPRGTIRVEVIDATTPPVGVRPAHGSAIEGTGLEACDAFSGDAVAHVCSWQRRNDLTALQGRPVRLKFVLRAARLFAFQPAAD